MYSVGLSTTVQPAARIGAEPLDVQEERVVERRDRRDDAGGLADHERVADAAVAGPERSPRDREVLDRVALGELRVPVDGLDREVDLHPARLRDRAAALGDDDVVQTLAVARQGVAELTQHRAPLLAAHARPGPLVEGLPRSQRGNAFSSSSVIR